MKKIKYLIYIMSIAALIGITQFTGCSGNGDDNAEKDLVYYCPMHPEVVSDKPGVCPICHMDLVLRDQDGDDLAKHLDEGLNLSESKMILANVSTEKVISGSFSHVITAYSYLDFTEQSRKYITARFNGRIEKLLADRTGEYINKGEPLFEIYSPDLVQAQNDYLLSAGSKSLSTGAFPDGKNNNNKMNEAAREKLQLMGVTAAQLKELESSGNIKMTFTYYSPFSGIIIEKKIQEGMYVNEGTLIYEVADMSSLWSISEIYENDIGSIKEGGKVKLKLQAYPGETFEGRVDLIYPVVNSQSRTVKIRSVIPNRNGRLKPNMYGETSFETETIRGLLIPEESVLQTGEKEVVWVQVEPGKFEYREVEVGRKTGNMYEVLSGLREGEIVASSGGFLIDSESQLRGGSGAAHNHSDETRKQEMDTPENKGTGKENKPSKDAGMNQDSYKSDQKITEIWNSVCPVIGGKVDPEVKTVEYKGRLIGFCCPGCDKDFIQDPEKYLSNLNENGTKYISTN